MPNTTPQASGTTGWSLETIFVHFTTLLDDAEEKSNQRFVDQEKAVHAALAAAEKAVDRAELNADKWRHNANEWRSAMDDREAKFMPREESIAGLHANADKIAALADRMNRGDGKGEGLTSGWQILLGIVVLLVGLLEIFMAFHK